MARRDTRKQLIAALASPTPVAYPPDAGIGDPVQLSRILAPFRAPQYLQGRPMRLPGFVKNPAAPLMSTGLTTDTPPAAPPLPETPVTDPHHYARVTGNTTPVSILVANPVFLAQPSGLRNLLAFRNPNGAGNIFIDFGQPASANSVFVLTPGQIFLFDEVVPQDDLYAFGSVGGLTLAFAYSNISA